MTQRNRKGWDLSASWEFQEEAGVGQSLSKWDPFVYP